MLAAKSRVAPLKRVTLPRLELCAAEIAAQLVNKFLKIMDTKNDSITLWSYSTIALGWIKSSANRFQTYVSNRITEIQTLRDPTDWKHVGTKDHSADMISRGVYPKDLVGNKLWWHGPVWLKETSLDQPDEHNLDFSLELLRKKRLQCISP